VPWAEGRRSITKAVNDLGDGFVLFRLVH
jgi:hypothetical protein